MRRPLPRVFLLNRDLLVGPPGVGNPRGTSGLWREAEESRPSKPSAPPPPQLSCWVILNPKWNIGMGCVLNFGMGFRNGFSEWVLGMGFAQKNELMS